MNKVFLLSKSFLSSLKNGERKFLFWNKNYGVVEYGRSNASRFQRSFELVRCLFSRCNLSFLLFIGLSFYPFNLKADFSDNDAQVLQSINSKLNNLATTDENVWQISKYTEGLQDFRFYADKTYGFQTYFDSRFWDELERMHGNQEQLNRLIGLEPIDGVVPTVRDSLYRILNSLGYNTIDKVTLRDNMGELINNSTNLVSKLDEIIELLKDDDSSGGTNSVVNITQDWLKEDTFKDSFGGFVEKYDSFLDSWGFSGGSSGESLKSYLDTLFYNPSDIQGVYVSAMKFIPPMQHPVSPFPGSELKWPSLVRSSWPYVSGVNPWINMMQFLSYQEENIAERDIYLAKKQAWNDWQAHTNLIAKLDEIYALKEEPSVTFNDESKVVTILKGYEGSSAGGEVIDIMPQPTNNVGEVIMSITNSTDRVSHIFEKNKIKDRYINEDVIASGPNYGVGEEVGGYSSGTISIDGWVIDLSVWGDNYRRAVKLEDLEKWRTVVGYVWLVASFVLCVMLVRKWGMM